MSAFIGECSKHIGMMQARLHLGVYIATSFIQPAKDSANSSQYSILLCTRDNFIKEIIKGIHCIEEIEKEINTNKKKSTAILATDYEKTTPTKTEKARTYQKYINYH